MSDSNIENYEASQRQRQPLKQVRVLSNANLRDSNRVEENSVRRDKNKKQPTFGICFDVDGVLARGTIAIPETLPSFRLLQDADGELRVPVTFVTNALNRNQDKSAQISNWLGITITPSQMIQAPGPLEVFTRFHDKFCLIVGQGKIYDIAKELGFKNVCTIKDITTSYPLLDMVDHDNRVNVAKNGYVEKDFPRVEAVILLGEPKRWESSLQILVDLLKTDGKPNNAPSAIPEKHLPVIACNADLQFMDRACMPRYGHGAFLLCLEALYKKVTGNELKYTTLVGKPSEVTFRYAEHCLSKQAKKMGIDKPLKRMYLIGDTPEVDIVGSNLYQRYVDRLHRGSASLDDIENSNTTKESEFVDPTLPACRIMPAGTKLLKQSVEEVNSVLVCTGVYTAGVPPEQRGDERYYHGHRDFPKIADLYKPTKLVDTVYEAIQYIMEREQMSFT